LGEFTESARSRLFIAPHRPVSVAAVWFWQAVPVFRDEPGQRRGQVVAQGHPLIVVILQGEDAGIGPLVVRQKLPEGVGIFERPGLQRLEAIRFIDLRHRLDDASFGGDRVGAAILEPSRSAGARSLGSGAVHGGALNG